MFLLAKYMVLLKFHILIQIIFRVYMCIWIIGQNSIISRKTEISDHHFFSQESINFTPPLILGVKSNL